MSNNLGDLIDFAFDIVREFDGLSVDIRYWNDKVKFIFYYRDTIVNGITFMLEEVDSVANINFLIKELENCVYQLLDRRFELFILFFINIYGKIDVIVIILMIEFSSRQVIFDAEGIEFTQLF